MYICFIKLNKHGTNQSKQRVMRKFTEDYIYGVIDTHIVSLEKRPESNYAFIVQGYESYAVITFSYPVNEDESKFDEHWFKIVKGESLVKLLKYVDEALEVISKNEFKN